MTRLLFLLLLLPTLALAQPAKAPASAPAPAKALSKAPAKALVAAKALPKAPAPAKALPQAPASVPASAPASAPAVALPPTPQKAAPAAWKVWLQANWVWLLVAVIIPSILNGLRKKGVRAGIVGFLEALLDRLSILTNKNSPGTLKAPLTRSQPPKE